MEATNDDVKQWLGDRDAETVSADGEGSLGAALVEFQRIEEEIEDLLEQQEIVLSRIMNLSAAGRLAVARGEAA